jgi:hypothetical protein
MLEVKVILHNANTGAVTEIASLTIVNDGTGDPPERSGNYDVSGWEAYAPPTRGRRVLEGRVEYHDRRRSVWSLVLKGIESCWRRD